MWCIVALLLSGLLRGSRFEDFTPGCPRLGARDPSVCHPQPPPAPGDGRCHDVPAEPEVAHTAETARRAPVEEDERTVALDVDEALKQMLGTLRTPMPRMRVYPDDADGLLGFGSGADPQHSQQHFHPHSLPHALHRRKSLTYYDVSVARHLAGEAALRRFRGYNVCTAAVRVPQWGQCSGIQLPPARCASRTCGIGGDRAPPQRWLQFLTATVISSCGVAVAFPVCLPWRFRGRKCAVGIFARISPRPPPVCDDQFCAICPCGGGGIKGRVCLFANSSNRASPHGIRCSTVLVMSSMSALPLGPCLRCAGWGWSQGAVPFPVLFACSALATAGLIGPC